MVVAVHSSGVTEGGDHSLPDSGPDLDPDQTAVSQNRDSTETSEVVEAPAPEVEAASARTAKNPDLTVASGWASAFATASVAQAAEAASSAVVRIPGFA